MADKPLRTDYTPLEVIDKRAQDSMEKGDRYVFQTKTFLIKFSLDIDKFGARIADELREKIVYRSDGGRFARALVRASGDLQLLYDVFTTNQNKDLNLKEGDPIRIEVILSKRKDSVPPNQWTMMVRLRAPDFIVEGEGFTIQEDKTRVASMRCVQFDKLCAWMGAIAKDIPGREGGHIRKMIQLADKLDCRGLDLWYYNRQNARDFADWHTGPNGRRVLSAPTKGKFPLDGYVSAPYNGSWRIYPFREMVQEFSYNSGTGVEAAIKASLIRHWSTIVGMFSDIKKDLGQAGPLKAWSWSSEMYDTAVEFLNNLGELQQDKTHLYSVFDDIPPF